MNPSKECVVAVYKSLAEAGDAIYAIDRHGFPMKLVSLVSASLRGEADVPGQPGHSYHDLPAECPRTCQGSAECEWSGPCLPKILQYGDDMEKNAAIGASAGALLGLLAGAGVVTVANGESVVLSGPIIATSAIVGSFVGAMFGWGVHLDQLSWYQRKVKAGKSLLLVHGNPLEVARAKRVLHDTHPAELHLRAESSADAYEIYAQE